MAQVKIDDTTIFNKTILLKAAYEPFTTATFTMKGPQHLSFDGGSNNKYDFVVLTEEAEIAKAFASGFSQGVVTHQESSQVSADSCRFVAMAIDLSNTQIVLEIIVNNVTEDLFYYVGYRDGSTGQFNSIANNGYIAANSANKHWYTYLPVNSSVLNTLYNQMSKSDTTYIQGILFPKKFASAVTWPLK